MDDDGVVSEVNSWTLAVACPSLSVVQVGTYSPQAWARDAWSIFLAFCFPLSVVQGTSVAYIALLGPHNADVHCSFCRVGAESDSDGSVLVSAGTDGERGVWRARFRRAYLRSTSSFPQWLFRRRHSGPYSVVFLHTGSLQDVAPSAPCRASIQGFLAGWLRLEFGKQFFRYRFSSGKFSTQTFANWTAIFSMERALALGRAFWS